MSHFGGATPSKIAQVSGRLLRYYDEIGLFKPQYSEPETGCRYYSADQLPRLNRILGLKDLGLSLEQIQRLLWTSATSRLTRNPAQYPNVKIAVRRRDVSRSTSDFKTKRCFPDNSVGASATTVGRSGWRAGLRRR